MTHSVTIYIPCYNAAGFIERCLQGVFAQTHPVREIIVVDDGPGDATAHIVSRYPVTVIRRSGRGGLVSARNLVFKEAAGDLVAGIDADCVPDPDWLKRLIEHMTDKKIVGVGGKAYELYRITRADQWRAARMSQHWGDERIVDPKYLYGCNTLYRKDVVTRMGLFNEDYRRGFEDVDMSIRLKKAGHTLIYEPRALCYHLRQDTVSSLLMTRWNWTFSGWQGKRQPDSFFNVCCKTYDNLAYVLRLLGEDIIKGRFFFVHIDAALFFHHLFHDLKFYFKHRKK